MPARNGPRWAAAASLAIVLALIAACATIREGYRAEPSYAFDRPLETTLGRAFQLEQARRPGESGFRLLNSGISALLTRAVLVDLAERSIDLQYYIYEMDEVGDFLMQRLVAAADRGVHVRILLDDHEPGFDDDIRADIDAHPNIEIRVFNPFPGRSRWSRALQLVLHLDQLGRRMHNKVFAVDGQAAILGGRNISNRYFEAHAESNFRDVDVLASGPVVKEVSEHFDVYWNSPFAVPVTAIADSQPKRAASRHHAAAQRSPAAELGPHAEYERGKADVERRLLSAGTEFIWGKSRAIAEPPVRAMSKEGKPSSEVMLALGTVRRATMSEMVMQTAYFVPGARGVEVLTELTQRGVRVRVLTNSLQSTDAPVVHVGYSRYRTALLEAGVKLYEYRADSPRPAPQQHLMRLGNSQSALHSKVLVYDRRIVWIGSANFDPRSRRINTEAGLLIESEPFAERLLKSMERDFLPETSWWLTLEPESSGGDGRIVWNGVEGDRTVQLRREPGVGWLRNLGVLLYSVVPGIEELL